MSVGAQLEIVFLVAKSFLFNIISSPNEDYVIIYEEGVQKYSLLIQSFPNLVSRIRRRLMTNKKWWGNGGVLADRQNAVCFCFLVSVDVYKWRDKVAYVLCGFVLWVTVYSRLPLLAHLYPAFPWKVNATHGSSTYIQRWCLIIGTKVKAGM